MLLLLSCRSLFILVAGRDRWQTSQENWYVFTSWSTFRPWCGRHLDWSEHILDWISDASWILVRIANPLPLFATLLFYMLMGRIPYWYLEDQCRGYRIDREPILHDVCLHTIGIARRLRFRHQIEAYWLYVFAANEREYRPEQYPRICRKYNF